MCRTGSFSLNVIIILTDIRAEVPGNIKIFTLKKNKKRPKSKSVWNGKDQWEHSVLNGEEQWDPVYKRFNSAVNLFKTDS